MPDVARCAEIAELFAIARISNDLTDGRLVALLKE